MIAYVVEDEENGSQEAFLKLSEAKAEAEDCIGNYNILRIGVPVTVESILLLLGSGGGYATSHDLVVRHEVDL